MNVKYNKKHLNSRFTDRKTIFLLCSDKINYFFVIHQIMQDVHMFAVIMPIITIMFFSN